MRKVCVFRRRRREAGKGQHGCQMRITQRLSCFYDGRREGPDVLPLEIPAENGGDWWVDIYLLAPDLMGLCFFNSNNNHLLFVCLFGVSVKMDPWYVFLVSPCWLRLTDSLGFKGVPVCCRSAAEVCGCVWWATPTEGEKQWRDSSGTSGLLFRDLNFGRVSSSFSELLRMMGPTSLQKDYGNTNKELVRF